MKLLKAMLLGVILAATSSAGYAAAPAKPDLQSPQFCGGCDPGLCPPGKTCR
jgi:hypothetical protein